MKLLRIILFAFLLLLARTAFPGEFSLPNPKLTPGVVAITDKAKVCGIVWGKDVRHVSEEMKREVCRRYGLECPIKTAFISALPLVVTSSAFAPSASSEDGIFQIKSVTPFTRRQRTFWFDSLLSSVSHFINTPAFFALSSSIFENASISTIKSMPMNTMRLLSFLGKRAASAQYVNTMGNRFKMTRINTSGRPTFMIQFETFRNWPNQGLINKDMSTFLTVSSISSTLHSIPSPNPATSQIPINAFFYTKAKTERSNLSIRFELAQTHCRGNDITCRYGVEIDHLVPRELGGEDSILNLWPQPWREARKKDRLENTAHKLVCAGKMPLKEAQEKIARNWVVFYREVFGVNP